MIRGLMSSGDVCFDSRDEIDEVVGVDFNLKTTLTGWDENVVEEYAVFLNVGGELFFHTYWGAPTTDVACGG